MVGPGPAVRPVAGSNSGSDAPAMERYDVVVVGAGLAGLQCARLLAERGRSVLLVDRKTTLHSPIHTTGIFVRRTLRDFDLPEDCLGPAVRTVVLHSPARRSLHLSSPHDEFRVGRMGLLYERLLGAATASGVAYLPATRFHAASHAEDRSVVALARGRSVQEVTTRFLIGADGTGSKVAESLGLSRNTAWIVGVEDVLEGVPLRGEPRFECFLDPDLAPGYLAWLVHDGEQVHLGVGGYGDRFSPAVALEAFRASLSGVLDLRGAELVQRRGGRIPVGAVLPHLVSARGLLVGDAAGAPSPLTAGGLDPCMRLSDLAAQVANHWLATGDRRVLGAYDGRAFRAPFRFRLLLRRALARTRSRGLLELGCAAARTPLLRPLAHHVFFSNGSFPDPSPKAVMLLDASTGSSS